jgi:hypothetical protein
MRVKQLSIFVENRSGRLAEVTGAMGAEQINIRALSLADTADFGILRLIVNDAPKAHAALKRYGFTVSETDVIAVEIPDHPGGLANVLRILADKKISVEYMYAFVEKSSDNAVVIFRMEDVDNAIKTLQAGGVRILAAEEVYAL